VHEIQMYAPASITMGVSVFARFREYSCADMHRYTFSFASPLSLHRPAAPQDRA
jgi:hypothetical protein